MTFLKKYLKIISIIILIFIVSVPLGIFFFENTSWKNGIAGSVETQESISFQIFIIISVLYYTFITKKFGVLKFFIGCLIFVGLMVSLIEMGVTAEGIENYKWPIIIGSLPIVLIIMGVLSSGDKNKQCTWCGVSKIHFKSGKEGRWFWEFRNKDGSQDKRVKTNFQKASYSSEF